MSFRSCHFRRCLRRVAVRPGARDLGSDPRVLLELQEERPVGQGKLNESPTGWCRILRFTWTCCMSCTFSWSREVAWPLIQNSFPQFPIYQQLCAPKDIIYLSLLPTFALNQLRLLRVFRALYIEYSAKWRNPSRKTIHVENIVVED